MLGRHYGKSLSAYAHGELSPDEAARVSEHLRGCARCREEFEQVRLGIRLAESLPAASAPASLWDGVEAALAKEATRPEQRNGLRGGTLLFLNLRPSARRWQAAAACAVLAIVAASAVWVYRGSTRDSWEVARLEGSPRIDSDHIGERGRLGVGDWLETDSASRAQIEVANIGEVEVEPNTRVRLVTTRLTEHRLELARGTLHARIWAPPRLFFVNTPSAVAADLGCAYTLEVDDAGRSLLRVTSGWVALETGERESLVPAGAACLTKPGTGPGTPFFEDAPRELIEALKSFDFGGGGDGALGAALAAARPRDTLTLWHLLPRAEGGARARVYERLAAIQPPPEGVTREAVLRLDARALDKWKDELADGWLTEDLPAIRKAWRNLWK